MGRRDPQNPQSSIQQVDPSIDVNSEVNRWQTLASTLPFRHPARASIAHNITYFHHQRHITNEQKGDLDQEIVGYAEALLRGLHPPLRNIVAFDYLTRALAIRFINFRAREDLDHIISYFRHLSDLPLVAGIERPNTLNIPVDAVLSRAKVGGRLEDIEDLISLFRHKITTVFPDTDDYRTITLNLAGAWHGKYNQTDESEDLTEAISHYRAVLTSYPLDHPSRSSFLRAFADLLTSRFDRSDDLNDAKDAITLYQELLGLLDEDEDDRMWILMSIANVYHHRFRKINESEDLEKAITQYREVLLLCPPDHENKDILLKNLAVSLIDRFETFGRVDCLEEAISLSRSALRLCPQGRSRRQGSLHKLAIAMHARYRRTQNGRFGGID